MSEATPTADADALAALIERLRADGGAPALAYEALRRRLILFFHVPLAADAEHLADIALERLGRRIAQGVVVENVRSYALGVARLLLKEAQAQRMRQWRAQNDPLFADGMADGAEPAVSEEALQALNVCLGTIEARARDLILAYYGADGGERIRLRQVLAAQLGLSLNALRNRALRLRDALERCVRGRLGPPTERDG